MSGYSGTPLPKKLGIKQGMTVGVIGAPPELRGTLGELPDGVDLHDSLKSSDIFLVFATDRAAVRSGFKAAMELIPAGGAIWVAWPKKSSGVHTDLTENTMRDLFLGTGMVDNKVCAIDETWSALRFVVRKENRDQWIQPGR